LNRSLNPGFHLAAICHSPEPTCQQDFHRVYRDADGDVHNLAPYNENMPAEDPRMRNPSL
jgi:hypothetical protein